MRARCFAAVLLVAAPILALSASGPSLAQAPPPVVLVPNEPSYSSTPPAPPPTVLLPPTSSEAAAASEEAPVKPPAPLKRPRRTAAIIQALDKTTAETLRFEAPVGQPIRYKDLVFTVHVCEDSAPELGQRGAAAHMEIESSPRALPGKAAAPSREIFRGWMFANAPGLHPFEHPVYDAWLIGCQGVAPAVDEAPRPAAKAPTAAPAPRPSSPPVVQTPLAPPR
jgi:hypothetical protein